MEKFEEIELLLNILYSMNIKVAEKRNVFKIGKNGEISVTNTREVYYKDAYVPLKTFDELLNFVLEKCDAKDEELIEKVLSGVRKYEKLKEEYEVLEFNVGMLNPLRQCLEFYERAEGTPGNYYGALVKLKKKNDKLEIVLLTESYHLFISHDVVVDTLAFDEQRFKRFQVYSDKELIAAKERRDRNDASGRRRRDSIEENKEHKELRYEVFLNGKRLGSGTKLSKLPDPKFIHKLFEC